MDVWNDPEARERFAADRSRLLSQYREHYGEDADRPGDAIIGILGMLGYPVHRASLPGEQLAAVDLQGAQGARRPRLRGPRQRPADVLGVLNASLAHEVGHIRLHRDQLLARGVEATFHHAPGVRLTAAEKRLEAEASCYASVFLVPRRDLVRSLELAMLRLAQRNGHAIPSGTIFGRVVFPLVRQFRVSGTLLMHQLVSLGFLVHDERTETLAVAPAIQTSERRVVPLHG